TAHAPAERVMQRLAARAILVLALCGGAGAALAQADETQAPPAETLPAQPEESMPAAPDDLVPTPEETPAAPAAAPSPGEMAHEPGSPGEVIEELHGALMEAMQRSDELGYEGRYRRIEPVVTSSFDTPLIVKVILSRYWDELTPEQRQEIIELFRRLSIATYASRFHDYDGEEFVEVGREELKRERLLIRTELRRPSDKP